MKYDKIIGILWHWDPLTEQGLSYDERLVRQSSGSMLALVQHLRPFKDIKADFIQSVAQLGSGGKFIGLIHRDSLSVDLHRELYLSIQNSLPDNAHYQQEVFGGGNDYLYYDVRMDTGLLNQEGDLVNQDSYEYYVEEDGEKVIKSRIASVVIDQSGDIQVEKRYFDQVWTYYQLHAQQLLVDCRNELLAFLAIHREEYENSRNLNALLDNKQPLLLEKLEAITGEQITREKLKLIYNNQPNVLSAYDNLEKLLTTVPTEGHDKIEVLRKGFDQLIKTMPETF
jgi:hypothetical protein